MVNPTTSGIAWLSALLSSGNSAPAAASGPTNIQNGTQNGGNPEPAVASRPTNIQNDTQNDGTHNEQRPIPLPRRHFAKRILYKATQYGCHENADGRHKNAGWDLFDRVSLVSSDVNIQLLCRKAQHFYDHAVRVENPQCPEKNLKVARTCLKTPVSKHYLLALPLAIMTNLDLVDNIFFSEPGAIKKLITEAAEYREHLEKSFKPDLLIDKDLARAYQKISKAYQEIRIDDKECALKYAKYALEIFQKLHPNQAHTDTAAMLCNVGIIEGGLNRLEDALAHQGEGTQMLLKRYGWKKVPGDLKLIPSYIANAGVNAGERNERIATALHHLGDFFYNKMGKKQLGVDYLRAAFNMRSALYAKQPPNGKLASSLMELGAALEAFNDRVKGIPLLEKGVAMYRALQLQPNTDSEFLHLATNLTLLGSANMHSQHSIKKARGLFIEAVKMLERFGKLNAPTNLKISAYCDLGVVEEKLGRWDESLRHKKTALDIYKVRYGENCASKQLAILLHRIGESYVRMSDNRSQSEGIEMLKKSVDMFNGLKINSVEVLLAVSALLPHVEKSEQQDMVRKYFPKLTEILPNAPTYHIIEVTNSFEKVINEGDRKDWLLKLNSAATLKMQKEDEQIQKNSGRSRPTAAMLRDAQDDDGWSTAATAGNESNDDSWSIAATAGNVGE